MPGQGPRAPGPQIPTSGNADRRSSSDGLRARVKARTADTMNGKRRDHKEDEPDARSGARTPSGVPSRPHAGALKAAAARRRGGHRGHRRRAPRPGLAQGTKLHVVRWVDFIPEADKWLKRRAPAASKALGAEIQIETINANDVQPRITAAVQSGSGADIFILLLQLAAALPERPRRRERRGEPVGKDQGGFYEVFKPSFQVGGKWLGVPHSIVGNAIAYRKSWFKEVGRRRRSRRRGTTLRKVGRPQEEGQALRPDPRPHLRRRADLRLPAAVVVRRGRDRPDRQEGRASTARAPSTRSSSCRPSGRRLRRGRPGLGRHQQQPRLPRRRDLRHPERRLDLHRRQAAEGQDQGRQGRAAVPRTSTTRRSRWRGRPASTRSTSPTTTRS